MPKTLQEKMMEKRQYRDLDLEIGKGDNRFNSKYFVKGYATTFNPYTLIEDGDKSIYESFTRESFKDTDMSDIIFQLNHEGIVHARLSNNTLYIELDEHGMLFEADLSKSQQARDLYEAIYNGLITKMSWGFRPGEYRFDKDTRTIIHTSVKKIYDVSAVSIPANDGTEISARSLVDGEIEKLRVEQLKHERLKLKIKIETENL